MNCQVSGRCKMAFKFNSQFKELLTYPVIIFLLSRGQSQKETVLQLLKLKFITRKFEAETWNNYLFKSNPCVWLTLSCFRSFFNLYSFLMIFVKLIILTTTFLTLFCTSEEQVAYVPFVRLFCKTPPFKRMCLI